MRKFFFIVLGVSIAAFGITHAVFAQATFSDVEGNKYTSSIEYVAAKGIVRGYSDGTFRPTARVNRAEMATMLFNAFALETEVAEPQDCFKDVKKTDWFSKYVCWAKDKNYIKGYKNGTFRPAQPVNEAEALVMALHSGHVAISEDTSEVWYTPFIGFAHNNMVFSKWEMLPDTSLTRGAVAHLVRVVDEIGNGKEVATSRKNFSEGCGKTPPNSVPTKSLINGTTRDYITSVPSSYNQNTPIKLVFAFHGRTNSNSMVRGYYKVEQAANGEAIFIYPAGLRQGSGYSWSDPGDKANNLRDFALFDQLLREFSKNYCIDLDEVYVVGHSLGAWFTNSLACARGDVIRAIGSVGGGTTIADCSGPVAAMIWHNPKDNLVPFSQGETARDQLKEQNKCSDKTTPTPPLAMKCVLYLTCGDEAPLVWCPHTEDTDYRGAYYPHTWPRSAGSEIWKFFTSLDQ